MGQPNPDAQKTTDDLLFQVSAAAHEYGKSKTKTLSEVLKSPTRVPAAAEAPSPGVWKASLKKFKEAYVRRRLDGLGQSSAYVSAFAKDHARIVHSPSLRRLQGKSQLIPSGEGEFFRTRLTHSKEVAEIGVRIARLINHRKGLAGWELDYDLINCACLLHDLGHPPFGHSGEEVLNEEMAEYGGFEGNAQTLRLVTHLENRLGQGNEVLDVNDHPRGLNLTVGVLAAVIKYDRPIPKDLRAPDGRVDVRKGYYAEEADVVADIKGRLGVDPDTPLRTVECQVMDVADDIAYSAYDLEDTLEAGIVNPLDFFAVDDAMLGQIVDEMHRAGKYPAATRREVLDALAGVFAPLLQDADIRNPYRLGSDDPDELLRHRRVYVGRTYQEAVLHARNPLIRRQYLETLIQDGIEAVRVVPVDGRPPFLWKVELAPGVRFRIECMKYFNYFKVINSRQLRVFHHRSKQIIRYLFKSLSESTNGEGGGKLLHEHERTQLAVLGGESDKARRMRLVADIIACLTDRDAVRLYFRLNPVGESSMFGYQ